MRRFIAGPAVVAGVAIAAMLVVAGGAYALGRSTGTIKVCVSKQGGALYAGKCHSGDSTLTWNKTGRRGAPGKALASALVTSDPSLMYAHGFSGVTHPSTGTYCLAPSGTLSSTTHPIALVTVEYEYSSGSSLSAFVGDQSSDCPTGDYTVYTENFSGVSSDSVAFYIVVPAT